MSDGLSKRSLKQDQRILFSYAAIKKLTNQIDKKEEELKVLNESLYNELNHLFDLFGVGK